MYIRLVYILYTKKNRISENFRFKNFIISRFYHLKTRILKKNHYNYTNYTTFTAYIIV